MSTPEDALERARAAAAEMRATGAYADLEPSRPGPPRPAEANRRLAEWAVVEPDLRVVRSTRPWGAPITYLKRGLLRLLVQYHTQLLGDQARFNLLLLHYVKQLEARVADLEKKLEVAQDGEK